MGRPERFSRQARTAATTRTVIETKGTAGTPPYMAPEQLWRAKVDARTDIYAAGAVLYEMATGQRPFGDLRGPMLSDAILHQEPRRPSELNPKVPGQLAGVILRALAKRPEDRPPSARALKDALERQRLSGLRWAWRSRTWRRAAALTAVVGALTGFGLYWVLSAWSPIHSLAVLPFANIRADPEVEYLSDGLADSIIDRVSRFPEVSPDGQVVPIYLRSSSRTTTGTNVDVAPPLATSSAGTECGRPPGPCETRSS